MYSCGSHQRGFPIQNFRILQKHVSIFAPTCSFHLIDKTNNISKEKHVCTPKKEQDKSLQHLYICLPQIAA